MHITKKILWFLIVSVILNLIVFLSQAQTTINDQGAPKNSYYKNTSNNLSNSFDSIWPHVYHPGRFSFLNRFVQITGTVKMIRVEKDGDFHIQILLDSAYTFMLNHKNILRQNGCLVVEIICANDVIQKDAACACFGYTNNVTIPSLGNHIRVSGPWVLDEDHGWNEIHPVLQIDYIH